MGSHPDRHHDEFGRSPKENERAGTHHGWASTHMVLGGRVKGGLLGEAPKLSSVHSISGPAPVIDTRALYSTVIENGGAALPTAFSHADSTPPRFLRAWLALHTFTVSFQGIRVLLFDLDGTFIDSSPGMARAANALRILQGLPPLPTGAFCAGINRGARGMLHIALDMAPEHPQYSLWRERFYDRYARELPNGAQWMPGWRNWLMRSMCAAWRGDRYQ